MWNKSFEVEPTMNDIFKQGTKVKFIMHQGINQDELDEIVSSARYLIAHSPIMQKSPGVNFEVRLTDIVVQENQIERTYDVMAMGEII